MIRGPGASVWGANALNGVINIITKKAADTQGKLLVVGTGNQQFGYEAFRLGGAIGDKTRYRLFGKYADHDHDFKAIAEPNNSDLWTARAGFRIDSALNPKNDLTIQGESYNGVDDTVWTRVQIGEAQPIPYQNPTGIAGGFVLGEWNHEFLNGSDSTLRLYYEKHNRTGLDLDYRRNTYDFEFQHNLSAGSRQQISWGFEYRYTLYDTQSKGKDVAFLPAAASVPLASGFLDSGRPPRIRSIPAPRIAAAVGSELGGT